MKNLNKVVIFRKEADISLARRREDYAAKRDILASEQNEAITKRMRQEEEAKGKSVNSGEEFIPEIDPENQGE
jgi:hypothetical protein